MNYRFLIVDDDGPSDLAVLILEFLPDAIIETVQPGKAALSLLSHESYDVVFLAINGKASDAFRLLHAFPHRNFELVFVSEDPEHAFEAIKEGATDYLLKPYKKPAIRDMLQRTLEHRSRYLAYHQVPPDPNAYLLQKISIPHQQGLWFITLQDILYLKADNSYTTIYTVNGEKITTSKAISRFESVLNAPWFFRIHKSYLINTSQFASYSSRNGDTAIMNNGDRLLISRYRLSKFLAVIHEINGALKV